MYLRQCGIASSSVAMLGEKSRQQRQRRRQSCDFVWTSIKELAQVKNVVGGESRGGVGREAKGSRRSTRVQVVFGAAGRRLGLRRFRAESADDGYLARRGLDLVLAEMRRWLGESPVGLKPYDLNCRTQD